MFKRNGNGKDGGNDKPELVPEDPDIIGPSLDSIIQEGFAYEEVEKTTQDDEGVEKRD